MIPRDKHVQETARTLLERKSLAREVLPDPRRRIAYEFGDTKDPARVHPQFKLMHWDNEVNFSCRLVDPAPGVEPLVSVDPIGRIEWTKGPVTARFYDVHHEGPQFEDGGFEVEVEFASRPASNVVAYTLRHKRLTFAKQPMEPIEGAHMPENVRGSYAVFHADKANNFDHRHYRTGKAFHIYRPSARDAEGREVWCDLNIDGDLMTVTVPAEWLDAAAYPVVVDPTFGYSSVGGSTAFANVPWARAHIDASRRHTATTGDTITGYSIYCAGTGSLEMAAYTFSGGAPVTRLATAASVTMSASAAWADSGAVSQALTNGTVYVTAMAVDTSIGDFYFDTPGGDQRVGDEASTLPSTWTYTIASGALLSMYSTYTAGGGGGSAVGAAAHYYRQMA